jgi:hypothetical protein
MTQRPEEARQIGRGTNGRQETLADSTFHAYLGKAASDYKLNRFKTLPTKMEDLFWQGSAKA